MSIAALHIPHGGSTLGAVTLNERNGMSYYPYVQGGPVEGGYLTLGGLDFVVYVNSRYAQFGEALVNPRVSALFGMAGVRMWGGAVRGDALVVLGAGDGEYERSLPPEIVSTFVSADRQSSA
jgi:hypothetical protein